MKRKSGIFKKHLLLTRQEGEAERTSDEGAKPVRMEGCDPNPRRIEFALSSVFHTADVERLMAPELAELLV